MSLVGMLRVRGFVPDVFNLLLFKIKIQMNAHV